MAAYVSLLNPGIGYEWLTRIDNYIYDPDQISQVRGSAHSTSSFLYEFTEGQGVYVQSYTTGEFFGAPWYRASQFSVKLVKEMD